MSLLLAAGLTAISAGTVSSSASSWSCAYVAERLPRTLAILGDDAVSAEETRAARRRLSLSEAILTRASNLALARSLGATRLIIVRCFDQGNNTTIEAQPFDTAKPEKGDLIRVVRTRAELPSAIDQIAQRLATPAGGEAPLSFRPPSPAALAKAGTALLRPDAYERARGLASAMDEDPGCIELRLSAVESLIAARDFDAAVRLAGWPPVAGTPPQLVRWLRFQSGAALLESGRYAEARTLFEGLRHELETAAVLNNLGVALFRLRDPAASAIFERGTFLADHRQRDIAFNRSLTLLFEGKAAAALPFIDSSLEAAPADVRTRLLRIWALRLLDREAERTEEWERLLAAAPSFSALGTPDIARRLERIFHSERKP
jgi:thioredoxin-like negative regulator of GroEL